MKFKSLIGQRFGRLVVVSRAEDRFYKCGGRSVAYVCECDCGNKKTILAGTLRNGKVRSCGCLQKEKRIETHTKHGASRHQLHTTWTNMKQRCYNPNNNSFKDYGRRGITVCDEWKNDFQAFYNWAMTHGYQPDLTIDRVDNSKGYSPENCRWATMLQQRHNRRDSQPHDDFMKIYNEYAAGVLLAEREVQNETD